MFGDQMAAALKRFSATLPTLVPDALVVLLFVLPGTATYLKWPIVAMYAVISWRVFATVRAHMWIFAIVRDVRTRIAHGLEHAATELYFWDEASS